MRDPDDVLAVVGMSARLPGARDVEEFWLNLVRGKESVSVRSDEELRAAGVSADELADPIYIKVAGMAPDVELFDARYFRMTPREAALCDPQIKLMLEMTHSALENAGYDPTKIGRGVGVYASGGPPHYAEQHLAHRPDLVGQTGIALETLNHSDYLATTVAYRLDLRGPSFTVLTACSSTLVALYLACQALRIGDCDMAIVGGADVEFPYGHGYRWAPGGVRSRDGHCRPFDAAASGTVFGGGAAAVVVKRLSDALADHDHICALIRGIAVNNDGADKVSFGAPSISGQVAVISEAMAAAAVMPAEISYVEAHGTGTALGDPVEVSALAEAYAKLTDRPLSAAQCAIGSVKSNLGHLGPVAGLAGLLKTVLSLEREQLPPSINFAEPNPKLDLPSTPFRVNDTLTAWPRDPLRPRRASVSSMGIGGTNAHAVLEEPPQQEHQTHDEQPRVVVWSATTVEAERDARENLGRFFTMRGEAAYADAVATLQHGRTAHPVRAAAVCVSARDAASALLDESAGRVVTLGRAVRTPRPVALLFPGQGTQQVGMAAGLYGRIGSFTSELDQWLERFEDQGIAVGAAWRGELNSPSIDDTLLAQPLLFAVEVSLARMWQSIGISPVALLGHSIGELAAASVAGVFTDADAARLVAARARAMTDTPPGAMLAVMADEDAVRDLLGEITIAAVNATDQIVLAGARPLLEECAAELARRGLSATMLRTSGAFHHPMLAAAADAFAAAFADVVARAPAIDVYSGATGRRLTAEQACDAMFWARQIVTPVRFAAALDGLLSADEGVLLEAGPGRGLLGLCRRHPSTSEGRYALVPSLPRAAGDELADLSSTLEACGRLWVEGYDLEWTRVGQGLPRVRVVLPGYPYQRQRHWVDAPNAGAPSTPQPAAATEPDRTLTGPAEPAPSVPTDPAPVISPFATVVWRDTVGSPVGPPRRGGTALVFQPGDGERALQVVLAVAQAGYRVVRARPDSTYSSGSGDEFGIRTAIPEDIDRMLDELAARGVQPDLLVYAAAMQTWEPASTESVDDQLDAAFFAPLAVVQRGLRTGRTGHLPRLVALTAGAVDVSGADAVQPVKAAVIGFIRTLAAETPWLSCKVIDVTPGTPTAVVSEEIRREDGPVIALRGWRRWAPYEVGYDVEPSSVPPIRPGGAYVITGGLGGLGIEVARGLAATGLRPKIALLGRRVPATGDELGGLLAAGDEWTVRVTTALDDLRMMGAQVRVVACDVTELRQLRRALDLVEGHFGDIHGVLHLAGVAGDGLLQVREPARAADVLRPKVVGAAALTEAMAGRAELDVLVFFSSRAGVDGLVGGGDYAAANAILDLAARDPRWPAKRVLSINYPSWRRVGMAAREARAPALPADPPSSALVWETVLSQQTDWALDEHRLADEPVLPGTGHLDLVLRAYRETVPGTGGDGCLVVSDVAFVVPLTAAGPRSLRIEFTVDGPRHAFAVRSRPADDPAASWARHVTGCVSREPLSPSTVDLAAVRARSTEGAPAPTGGPDRMFLLGPRWQCVRSVYVADEERIVELELPEAFHPDLDRHELHPALLDCATGAARREGEPFHVPFLYRRMVVYAPLPATVSSHIRRRPAASGLIVADIDIVDPAGGLLVRIEGFTMRRTDSATFRGAGAAGSAAVDGGRATGTDSDGPTSRAPTGSTRRAAPSSLALGPDAGIEPETGCDLLFTLLSAHTPEQVLVRPFHCGQPVGLTRNGSGPAVAAAEPGRGAAAAPVVAVEPMTGNGHRAPVTGGGAAGPGNGRPTVGTGNGRPTAGADHPAAENGDTAVAANGRRETVEDQLRLLWRQVLGIDEFDLDDDFFELGGNSLTAVEVMSRIRDTFGVELNIGLLFDAPTLRQLAALLGEQSAARGR